MILPPLVFPGDTFTVVPSTINDSIKNALFHCRMMKTMKESPKIHFFWVLKMFPLYLFRAALYELMFVVDKDVLFHKMIHVGRFNSYLRLEIL